MTAAARLRAAYVVLAVTIVALDQWTKKLVLDHMTPYVDSIDVIDGWFRLVHYRNTGAAFGLGAGGSGSPMPLVLTGLAVGVFIFVVIYIMKSSPASRLLQTGLHLVAGGAIGNLIDRFRLGSVVDFLEVYVVLDGGVKAWPAFNVADSAICVGIGLLFLDTFLSPKPAKESNPDESLTQQI